tara:strand:+ start:7550 stop:7708 length:159 start_codon:yes stop_codon:yes gene_type:complete
VRDPEMGRATSTRDLRVTTLRHVPDDDFAEMERPTQVIARGCCIAANAMVAK